MTCWHCTSKDHDTGDCPDVFSAEAEARRERWRNERALVLLDELMREIQRRGYVLRSLEIEESDGWTRGNWSRRTSMGIGGVEVTLPQDLKDELSAVLEPKP